VGRRHADEIEVRRRDEVPEQFLWRSRLYLVREVLEHWFEADAWWASGAALALATGSDSPAAAVGLPAGTGAGIGRGPGGSRAASDLVLAPIPASPKWAQRAWGEPAPDVGASVGPISIDDGEREYWRVEAAAGRSASLGVYDLCFDWSHGKWQLMEVHD
jgi:hypothetical protein